MMTKRFAAWASLVLWAVLPVAARAAELPRPATLTVTGDASVSRAPDRAIVSFAIQTTDANSGKATSANAAIANALTAKLVQIGLPAADVVTAGYGLNYAPRPTKPDPASDQQYGYTVTRTINATVDAVDRAGAVIDAGVSAGATSINGVSFVLRDAHAAQRSAQAAALADAVAQARSLASAAGVRLVRILSIAPGGGEAVAPKMMRMPMMAMAAAPVPTTIDPGNLTVDAQVTLRYEIAPSP
jgi:uncharacterized protein YggE